MGGSGLINNSNKQCRVHVCVCAMKGGYFHLAVAILLNLNQPMYVAKCSPKNGLQSDINYKNCRQFEVNCSIVIKCSETDRFLIILL